MVLLAPATARRVPAVQRQATRLPHRQRSLKPPLRAQGVPFDEAPIPGWDIHQLFLRDPRGLRIEMTFWMKEEA